MTNLKHYFETGAAYCVTSVTRRRDRIFHDSAACRFLITCLEYQKQILGFRLYGFVVMPDHFHCVLQPLNGFDLSKIMNCLKGNFARKFNVMSHRSGVLWQKSYYETGMRTMPRILSEIAYLHQNPVRAGLVASAGEYEFSSYHYYYGDLYRNLIDRLYG